MGKSVGVVSACDLSVGTGGTSDLWAVSLARLSGSWPVRDPVSNCR